MESKHEERKSAEEKIDFVEGEQHKPDSSSESKEGDRRAIVDKVRDWMFGNQAFEDEVQTFVRESAELIDDIEQQEMKLQYTQLHQRFIELFESRVTSFIEREGSTVFELYSELQEMSQDDSTEEAAFVAAMMSLVDFEIFMVLLRETKRGHKWSLDSMFSP
jgi:hypothetical protein